MKLRGDEMAFRVGLGYDVHKLVEGRKLIMGGVEIPHDLGLLGHSDADVLIHAIMDALLGAGKMGDIGKLFPDTDPKYKGISSIELLKCVKGKMDEKGLKVVNIDSIIVAQKPKMRPYIEEMEKNIANALDCDVDLVNVKATTEEELGFTGRKEGISAKAVCLLEF
jgi:2-C-methyl-D-erythritol 2,4-cyclodiphosphate synthase